MSIQTQTVEYRDGDTLLKGYLAYNDEYSQGRPTVMIAHAWDGRGDFPCDKARRLAELGFTAVALDNYGDAKVGSNPEENTAMMQPLLEDRTALQRRMQAGLEATQALPQVDAQNIVVIGYCFGGLCALDLARTGADIKGAVSFHGLLQAPGNIQNQPIAAKVLILHGDKDPMVPVEQVIDCQQEMTNAGADWQLHTFGTAMHSFTNPKADDAGSGLLYNADADRRSWKILLDFLQEAFS